MPTFIRCQEKQRKEEQYLFFRKLIEETQQGFYKTFEFEWTLEDTND